MLDTPNPNSEHPNPSPNKRLALRNGIEDDPYELDEYDPGPADDEEYKDYPGELDDHLDPEERTQLDVINQTITYQPFNATEEFSEVRGKLKHLRGEAKEAQQTEGTNRPNRLAIELYLREFRKNLTNQEVGIKDTLTQLYDRIHQAPNTPFEELWQEVAETAPNYRLTATQLSHFYKGLQTYSEAQANAKRYREQYPDDRELFEQTFGFEPQGEINVIQAPMTLMFRCHNETDYIMAYSNKTDIQDVTPEQSKKAQGSAGTAPFSVHNPDLNSVAMLENVSKNFRYVEVEHSENIKLEKGKKQYSSLHYLSQLSLTDTANHGHTLQKTSTPDDPSDHFSLIDNEQNNSVLGFTLDKQSSKLHLDTDPGTPRYSLQYDTPDWTIDLYQESMAVTAHTDITIASRTRGLDKVQDSQIISSTHQHEAQHKLDALFTPLEYEKLVYEINARVAAKNLPPNEAIAELTNSLVHLERRLLEIDRRARTEILAFTRENHRSFAQIGDTLKNSPGYNYQEIFAQSIAEIPSALEKIIRGNFVIWSDDMDVAEEVDKYLDPQAIEAAVKQAFGPDYHADIDRWIGALERLADKGYTNDEIINWVYQAPINKWPALARRVPPKDSLTSN